MKKIVNALVLVSLVSSTSFARRDPLGETADYLLDKDPKRTSSMIKSGTVKASVVAFHESTVAGPAYDVNLDYQFKVALLGTQQGTEKATIEKEFFTEEFLIKLRKEKYYEGAYFKAKHMGYADARNLDGKFYPNCDLVLLYDLKKPPQFLVDLIASAFDVEREQIEDLKALVHVYKGIPVLGGAKIDVSGRYSGMDLKAGADYIAKW